MTQEIKMEKENITRTTNGAIAYTTTFSALVDQFGVSGNYMNRSYDDVCKDMESLWSNEDKNSALRFVFYLRMITRNVNINNKKTEKVQKGLGLKDEFIKRLLWLANNEHETFLKNLWIVPLVGSWKDLFVLMHYDLILGVNCLNRKEIYALIASCLKNNAQTDLIKKYIPRVESMKKCKTDWAKNTNRFAKELANFLGMTRLDYNHMKSKGNAHTFQKIICNGDYTKLVWDCIPGKALRLLINGNFIQNHKLEDSIKQWIDSKPSIPFNGYVYELAKDIRSYYCTKNDINLYKRLVADKQFETLINKAVKDGNITENVLPILDTSGSMETNVGNTTAMNISMSLGVFFATINKGYFHDCVMMFDSKSYFHKFQGKTFSEKLNELPLNAMGSTNFQSVVDALVELRTKHPNIPLEEYPTTLLVVSDMQFNPTTRKWENHKIVTEDSNNDLMKKKLKQVFPSDFVDSMKFIWWNCASSEINFPTECKESGEYLLSGFDGSIITLLLGDEVKEKNQKPQMDIDDMINLILSQEILQMVSIS